MLKGHEIPLRGVVSIIKPTAPGWFLCPENLISRIPFSNVQKPSSLGASTLPCEHSVLSAASHPLSFSGAGARMTDADGNRYIDYVLSWGPLMLGHCAPKLLRPSSRLPAREPASELDTLGVRPRRAGHPGFSFHRKTALRLQWYGSDDVGHSPGPCRYQPQVHRQVRRLLSRPQ